MSTQLIHTFEGHSLGQDSQDAEPEAGIVMQVLQRMCSLETRVRGDKQARKGEGPDRGAAAGRVSPQLSPVGSSRVQTT